MFGLTSKSFEPPSVALVIRSYETSATMLDPVMDQSQVVGIDLTVDNWTGRLAYATLSYLETFESSEPAVDKEPHTRTI